MLNFEYCTPTNVVFGKDAEKQAGSLISAYGAGKVLVHYGSGSVVRSGLLARITASLEEAGISYVTLGGVVPNPRLSLVRKGIELAKKEGVDFILAVGGGSVIDSSKAIAYGSVDDGDVWDFYCAKRVPKACLPVGAVLTIAAAGSEMSNSSVITNEDGWLKRGANNEISRCKFAICNPELTYTLPAYQTASGCVDIMMHTMERYFTAVKPALSTTDAIAEALLRDIMKNAKILVKEPENYESRAAVMWASSLSHNGLTGCGTEGGDWACHRIEHELGGLFDCAHGAGLGAIWASWARFVIDADSARFAAFAHNVMGIKNSGDDMKDGLEGISAMEEFYRSINMPVSVRELLGKDVSDAEISEMARKATWDGTRKLGAVKKLGAEDISAILKAAR